jgi:hypothetical protein
LPQMDGRTGLWVIFRDGDQARADGIERDIAQHAPAIRLIQWGGKVAILPEMALPALARISRSRAPDKAAGPPHERTLLAVDSPVG